MVTWPLETFAHIPNRLWTHHWFCVCTVLSLSGSEYQRYSTISPGLVQAPGLSRQQEHFQKTGATLGGPASGHHSSRLPGPHLHTLLAQTAVLWHYPEVVAGIHRAAVNIWTLRPYGCVSMTPTVIQYFWPTLDNNTVIDGAPDSYSWKAKKIFSLR